MQIVMPQRNTEPFPCRRGSEIAADRYEAPKFLDVNPSLLQRDNLQWRLRELLQAKDNLQMRLEKNQQDLLRQDEMYDALLREENLLFQRRLDPYFFTSAQRRIREDLQDVQWKKRLLFRDHDILRQDEEWIKHEIWKLEWERHHESLRRPLSSSRTRPESAPRSADFGHSVSTRARAHERSHTPVPALKPMRQQSAPFQSPKAVKPDTFDTRISFPSSLSSSLPTPGGLPSLPQTGHLATHTLASPQLRTSPASSPSHSLAPVTNMASATASTEATLQDMQDTVLPDLTDPLKERLEEHELWLGMTWSFEAFEALPVHDDKWLCAIIPILHWQLWTWYEMLYCKFLITELHITNSTFQLSCIYNILIYLIYLCIYIYRYYDHHVNVTFINTIHIDAW